MILQHPNIQQIVEDSKSDVNQLILLVAAYTRVVDNILEHTIEFEKVVAEACIPWLGREPLAEGIKALVRVQKHYYHTEFDDAVSLASNAADILKKIDQKELFGVAHLFWGSSLRSLGEPDDAVNHLMIASDHLSTNGIFSIYKGHTHYQLAEIYTSINDYEGAEKNYRMLAENEDMKNLTPTLFRSLNGLGNLYMAKKDYPKAIEYLEKAMGAARTPVHISRGLCDLGVYAMQTGNLNQAITYLSESFSIRQENNLEAASATSLIGLSESHLLVGETSAALDQAMEALRISLKYNAKSKSLVCYKILSDIYATQKDWENAYHYRVLHGELHDTISSQKIQNIYKLKNKKIEKQKVEIEVVHKEITDSINYAKRIQEAIMPSMESMHEELRNSFVLYLPKDVVAGDFFWMESIEDFVYFAAADCTGHGVPGAMVSVICSNALTKALMEEEIRDPGKLLDKTRELVIEKLAKSGDEVKDGMDISLCAWNRQNNELNWSGANNPLWILKLNHKEILEIKPDKQPIGKYEKMDAFTSHSVQLNKGDTIYIFTDGYQDQFGGPKGKKFKVQQLKALLLAHQDKSMAEQQALLKAAFRNWQGANEQVDDVCMIGVKI